MGKYLDEIMTMSDKGYIDSFEEIEKLTEKVMNMEVRTLMVRDGLKPDAIIEDLLVFSDLPEDCSYNVRICDMLNMAREIGHCEFPGDSACTARYASITAELLNKAARTSGDIKLFLSISVKAFADFMDKRSGENNRKCKRIYEKIVTMAKENALLEVTEKTTIKAVIDGVRQYMTKWNVRMQAKTFVQYAENCCEIIKNIFVDLMLAGYKEMLDFDKLWKAVYELHCKDVLEDDQYPEVTMYDEFDDDEFDYGEFDDYEGLPFDIDETDEYEQCVIEFQPLSDGTDDKSHEKSGGNRNELSEELRLLCEQNKAS